MINFATAAQKFKIYPQNNRPVMQQPQNPLRRFAVAVLSFGSLAALAAGLTSQAATINLLNDDFSDGGLSDGTDLLDAVWTSSGQASNNPVSVAAFDSAGNTSNALFKNNTNAGMTFNVVKGAFTNTTALGIGDSITLAFDFRFTATPGASGAGLRIALGTSSTTELFQLGTGGTASGNFAHYNSADTTAGTGSVTFTPSPVPTTSITDTLAHTFSLTLTRTGSTSLDFSSTVDGVTVTSSSGATSISAFTFNRVLIGEGSPVMKYTLDNVNVFITTAVPEPSAYAALAGLAALGLAAFKRPRYAD